MANNFFQDIDFAQRLNRRFVIFLYFYLMLIFFGFFSRFRGVPASSGSIPGRFLVVPGGSGRFR